MHQSTSPRCFELARRRVAAVGSAIIWLGSPMIVAGWSAVAGDTMWWIPSLVIGNEMLWVQWLCRRGVRHIDAQERRYHTHAARRIRQGSDLPFVLYLRSFWVDSSVPQGPHLTGDPIDPASLREYERPVDRAIERPLVHIANRNDLHVVKLGYREKARSVRVSSTLDGGDGWFDVFKDLATRSRWIVVVPATTPSSLRELEWLRANGLLEKIIATTPPRDDSPPGHRLSDIRDRLSSIGLSLPSESPWGVVFRWDETGNVCVTQRVIAWRPLWLSAAIAKVSGSPEWFNSPLWLTLLLAPLVAVTRFLGVWLQITIGMLRNWWIRIGDHAGPVVVIALVPVAFIMVSTVALVIATAETARSLVALWRPPKPSGQWQRLIGALPTITSR